MLKKYRSKLSAGVVGASAGVVGMASVASAALTVEQQAAVDAITLFNTDMTTVAWGLILAITGTFITIKLYKKYVGKST